MSDKCLQIKIYGKVQGVWFRAYTEKKANKLNLKGWVQNESDGTVLAEVKGPASRLKDFLAWCKEGSPLSKVKKVESKEIECKDYPGFEIKR